MHQYKVEMGHQTQICLAKPSQHVCQARDMLLECKRGMGIILEAVEIQRGPCDW